MIIADTSGLLAILNEREPTHDRARDAVVDADEPLVVSPYVIAELDYLLATRLGVDAALAVARELAGGAYVLAEIDAAGLTRCADVIERYRDQNIGVADASLVVLADRYETTRVLTLDHRHFTVLRSLSGDPFQLLP